MAHLYTLNTWVTTRKLTELRHLLRDCPEQAVREEGLACLRLAKPEYLANLIKQDHPDRVAAWRWIASFTFED